MNKSPSLWQRILTYLVCAFINIQPALAKVVVNGSSTQVIQAGNGVEVVNIAKPNDKGLSHNQYQQFDVNKEGLILNNSTEQLSQSQLGGILQNNPNLNGNSAKVILNEVTGPNQSRLQGYTEVHGGKANVIVANPHGITCDGCGFINTPRVTLSTGTPQITQGEVTGFDVTQGAVTVEGLGLDATNQTYFDIISRTAKVNAEIHANDLTVVTGQNKVDYQTNKVTKKASSGSKPKLAIDSSSLGGMYAGRIALIATEDGVGVNIGNLAASEGDIQITADGRIVMGSASAKQSVNVTTQNELVATGKQYANENLTLSAKDIVAKQATIAARKQLELTSEGKIELTQSEAIAGVNAQGQIQDQGQIKLDAKQVTLSGSKLAAKNDLTSKVDEINLDSSSTIYSQNAKLEQLKKLNNQGKINTEQALSLQADKMTLTGSGRIQAEKVTVAANQAELNSSILTNAITVEAEQQLTLGAQADLQVVDSVSLQTTYLDQQGKINAGGDVTVVSGTVKQAGNISSAGQLDITANSLNQLGCLVVQEQFNLTTESLNQSGEIRSGTSVSIDAKQIWQDGLISAVKQMDIKAQTLTQEGKLQSGDTMNLTLNTLEQNGTISAEKNITIDADDMLQKGTISTNQKLAIEAKELEQKGQLSAAGDITVHAVTIDQKGEINTAAQLTLAGKTIAQSGALNSAGDMEVTAQDMALKGDLYSEADIHLKANKINQTSGQLVSKTLSIEGQQVTLAGKTATEQVAELSSDTLALNGKLQAKEKLIVEANTQLTINSNGQLLSEKELQVDSATVKHQGKMEAGEKLVITTEQLTHSGVLQSAKDLLITATSVVLNKALVAGNDIKLTLKRALNTNKDILAGHNLSITATSLTNQAELSSGNQTQLNLSGDLINQSSGLISGQDTQINTVNFINQGNLQALNNMSLTAQSLQNTGALVSLNDLDARFSNTFTNSSLTYAGNNADLFANKLYNTGDLLVGNDLLFAKNSTKQRAALLSNSSGSIESLRGDINIYANKVENKRTILEIESIFHEDSRDIYSDVFNSQGTAYEPEYKRIKYNCNWYGGSCSYRYRLLSDDELTVVGYKEEVKLKQASKAARLVAGGDINIYADQVDNDASQMAGDNIHISARQLNNVGYELNEYTIYYDYLLPIKTGDEPKKRVYNFDRTAIRRVKMVTNDMLRASISASGNVTVDVADQINNSVIESKVDKIAPDGTEQGMADTQFVDVTINGVDQPQNNGVNIIGIADVEFPSTNDVPFPTLYFPDTPNGLFIFNDGPNSKYLIETNPALINLGQFLGSDYFMGNVSFNPEKDITFLGDAFYDTRIITQAIFEQTGQRYLNNAVGNDFMQMQQLMDAAASEQHSLDLVMGIALTSGQIAGLKHDIIWYEEIIVNGQTVLAPKLYLAQVTQENISEHGPTLIAAEGQLALRAGKLYNEGNLDTNGDMVLSVADKIRNINGTIFGERLDIQAGEIRNEAGNIKALDSMSLSVTNDIHNEMGNIKANNELKLSATGDIRNISGTISGGDVTLTSAKGSIINQTHSEFIDNKQRRESKTLIGKTSFIEASGNLTMNAGKDIISQGANIQAGGDALLMAANDIELSTVEDKSSVHYQYARGQEKQSSTTHKGSELSGQNITLQAGNDITLSGSQVSAKQSANVQAKGDVNILAVNDSEYSYYESTKKKSFGRKKTTIKESYNETVKGSAINAGEDINITAQQFSQQVAGGDSDINLIGSELNAQGDVNLTADGDVILAATQYKEYQRKQTIKKGFGGLSGSNKGSINDATLLEGSHTIAASNVNINSGNDVGVIASEVEAGGNLAITAVDKVVVGAGEAVTQSTEWNEEFGVLKGGNLFEMESNRAGETERIAQGSTLTSGDNVVIDAGTIAVVGSDITSQGSVELSADTGDIDIVAAQNSKESFDQHEKLSVGLGEISDLVKIEDGQLRIGLGEATYDKVDNQTQSTTQSGSNIVANGDIQISADSDIQIEGSNLIADADNNQQGSIALNAENVTIKEAEETLAQQSDELHGKAEVSLVVQHQAVETVKAAEALKASTDKLKQAESDYKQYQKQKQSLENTLATLEQEYADNKPGVTFDDIETVKDLLSQVEGDEQWYVTGIALASEDVVSKTTQLYKQVATAGESAGSGAYGFNAGLHLDIEATQTESHSNQTTSIGSNLAGQNISINADNHASIQGSQLEARDTIAIDANEVTVTASQDTSSSKTNTQSGNISASMTVYGASSGVNVDVSGNRNQSTSNSTTHNNSVLTGDNIQITSTADTNIIGGNVDANQSLTVDVGGDLNVASVQDRHSSSHKGAGFSAGMSFAGGNTPADGGVVDNSQGAVGEATGANGGINSSNGRTYQKETVLTTLTSGGEATITVANNTDIKGAVVATIDENGEDAGHLTLTTDTFSYNDLSNTSYNSNQSMGINSSVGVQGGEIDSTYNSSSLQYKNESNQSLDKTLTTVGQGNFTIADSANSTDTSVLNRDVTQTEKAIFDVDRQQGNIDVTVDHRLLTEDGRKDIAEDIKRTELAGNSLADVMTEESVEVSDTFEHMDVLQKELDVQKQIALENPEAAQILNNLDSVDAESKQYALEVYVNTYAEVMGISIDEARLIAFEGGAKGNHIANGNQSTIELNDAETTNGSDAVNTIIHEGTHASISQGAIGGKGEHEESYANLIGGYAEGNYEFVLGNYDLGDLKTGDVNQHIGNNSSSQLQHNNLQSVITHLGTPDDEVDNRLPNRDEAYAIKDLTKQIAEQTGQDAEALERSVTASACYLINCSKGLAIGSEERAYYKQLEQEGKELHTLQEQLLSYEGKRFEINTKSNYPPAKNITLDNLFTYDKTDAYVDSESEANENYYKHVAEQTGQDIATIRTAYATAAILAVAASGGKSKGTGKLSSDKGSVVSKGKGDVKPDTGDNINVGIRPEPSGKVTPVVFTDKQIGKKLGKHVYDFGGDPSNADDRAKLMQLINDIANDYDKVVTGTFRGQGYENTRGFVNFRIKGNDVVVIKPDGSFVTILKDGVNNSSVRNALNDSD